MHLLNKLKCPALPKIAVITLLLSNVAQTASVQAFADPYQSLKDCEKDGYYNCEVCVCSYTSLGFDKALNLIATISISLLLIGYIFIKELSKKPGDLILISVLANFLYSISWLFFEFNADSDCMFTAYLNYFSKMLAITYDFAFFTYVARSLRNPLKSSGYSVIPYHMFGCAAAIFMVILRTVTNSLGRNIYGYCSDKTSMDPIWSLGLISIYLVFVGFTAYLVIKNIPKNKDISNMREQFLKFYSIYLILNALITILSECIDLSILYFFKHNSYDDPVPELLSTIGVCLRLSIPLILVIARVTDPLIRQAIKRRYKSFKCKGKKKENKEKDFFRGNSLYENFLPYEKILLEEPTASISSNSVLSNQSPIKNISLIAMSPRKLKKIDFESTPTEKPKDYIREIQESFKTQILYTILSSIHFYWYQTSKNKKPKFKHYHDHEENERIAIDHGLIGDEKPDIVEEIQDKNYTIMDGLLTVYAPTKFDSIIETDSSREEITNSLDLARNFLNIRKSGINGGGKSGEFFFFSEDNKLIIKTIRDSELTTLLRILPDYIMHLKKNRNSLISKIYGAFTVETRDPYEKYNIVLMKNINGYPNHCLSRVYDLKGSTFGRKKIRDPDMTKYELSNKGVLKDLDFNHFEQKIHISNDIVGPLYEAIKSDAAFLREKDLIDYSLIVFLIDEMASEDPGPKTHKSHGISSRKDEIESFMIDNLRLNRCDSVGNSRLRIGYNPFSSIKSEEEEFYYHLGIIDYLNNYGWKKRFELFWKKFSRCNPNLDISVQNPDFYAERFVRYIKQILF